MLTKETILGGIKNTTNIELPMYDDEVAVREISDLEYNTFLSGMKDIGTFNMVSTMKGNQKNNEDNENLTKEDQTSFKTSLPAMDKKKLDAKIKLALAVLDNEDNPEKFNKKDLESLKAGALDLIIDGALKHSGLDELSTIENDMKDFRKKE
ncbi:MAG: hypothetical protein KO202_05745 [Methanobacteriaceae archaeon]|jgi:hypothetical protein|nr:hypothetical protein [Methanobacteriaceae archaeon]